MGKHYLLNLYGCSFVLLDDEKCLIDLEKEVVALKVLGIYKSEAYKPRVIDEINILQAKQSAMHKSIL